MNLQKYQELEKNLKLRNRLLKLGIGCVVKGPKGDIGPTGPQGEIGATGPQGEIGPTGPAGEVSSSSNEGLFFTSFSDTNDSNKMTFEDSWFIPSESKYFTILNDTDIEVQPGIYEITFSGLVNDSDDTHGATFYLQNIEGSALKDLTFELSIGSGKQMTFSQTIIFRFEKVTVLEAVANILGDASTSNVTISSVNLLMKKIHE